MALPTEQQQIYVAIWSKVVETQMHFNEMSVKSRQFGLGFVSAALGLGIVLLGKDENYSIPVTWWGGFDLHLTVIVAIAAAGALGAVMILDLNVYHKMLRGAVKFNEDFERNYMKEIFVLEKGMTQAITHYSQISDAKTEVVNDRNVYLGTKQKNALSKIAMFYYFSMAALLAIAVVLFLTTANFGQPGKKKVATTKQTNALMQAPPKKTPPPSSLQQPTEKPQQPVPPSANEPVPLPAQQQIPQRDYK